MSWIQENKFVAGLAGATAVIGGAILFFGLSQGSSYNDKLEKYEELKSQYSNLEKSTPYPSSENLKHRGLNVGDYETEIKEVRSLVLGYRPEKLEVVSPEQFKDLQVKMTSELNRKFKEAHAGLPENCLFGFEKYATTSVRAGATPQLVYELKAVQLLMETLAELKPEKIVNTTRDELPEEKGLGNVADSGKPARGSRRSNRSKDKPVKKAYELMPVELTFTARENVVREFLIKMVNSEEYFYAIRAIRVRNEKQIAPNLKDADFPVEVKPMADDGFGSLEGLLDDASGSDENENSFKEDGGTLEKSDSENTVATPNLEIADGELVLKEVLGGEKLHACIRFDIVLIGKDANKPPRPGKDHAKR